jgi:flagellar hook-basal body complex protein FliE
MPLDPITTISSATRLTGPAGLDNPKQPSSAFDSFGQVLGDALSELNQTEARSNQSIASLAAGEDVDLHQVMLSMQETDIAVQLALQVRNKLVEAYQEVMRMQV